MIQKRTCPTGERWDQFLLNPGMAERQELERHLEECPYCRFVIAQKRTDLGDLQRAWDESAVPDFIFLSPLILDDSFEEPAAALLAAQGIPEDVGAKAVTLSSPDQKVFMRAIRDSHTKETWLYLMAEDPDLCRNVLIKLFGREGEYLTDSNGRVNLGVIEWPGAEKLTAEVHLPKATFALTPMKDLADSGDSVVLNSSAGDRIKVTFMGDGRNRLLEVQILEISDMHKETPLRIAVRLTEMERLLQVKPAPSGRATFDGVETLGTLEIYLYQ